MTNFFVSCSYMLTVKHRFWLNELPQESDQFRYLRTSGFANLKGVVGLIMTKASAMRISIPLDLSSRSFIPLPRFMDRDLLCSLR
jgi:hypothetical protein